MKNILITGASRGIGKATAKKFLENGWTVYGSFLKSLDNMQDLIKKYPKTFVPVGPYDLTNFKEINKLIAEMKQFNFDALFLNAGIFSENDDFMNFQEKEFLNVMTCNLYAPLMISIKLQNNLNNNGCIVLMSSNDAYSGAFASISYSVSKAAILNVVKSLSVNYGRKGIRVNSIAPGAIDTDMNTPEQVNESPKWTPLQRVAQPYEVANVVYFLCGNESSFINGENVTIDGGYGNVSILLKKEMESSRVYGDYAALIQRYNNIKKGETIISVDVADSGYAWVEKQSEVDYLNAVLASQNRGANVFRYVILPEDKIKDFKSKNKIFKKYQPLFKNIVIVSKEELYKRLNDVYQVIGKGCDVYIDKNGKKESFIDFYSSDDSVGVLTDNEDITSQLFEKIMKLKKAVENKQLKIY